MDDNAVLVTKSNDNIVNALCEPLMRLAVDIDEEW
jgi:hypothetical protein